MRIFVILAACLALIAGRGGQGQKNAHHSQKKGNKKHDDSQHNKPNQNHHKSGHGNKHDNSHGKKHDNGHGNKDDNGHGDRHDSRHGDNHLPTPDSEDFKECGMDVEYVFSESETETERCSDGKNFFYTDRYKNETFCSNSATVDDGECWWDTSVESNCLESTECVWLTNSADQGVCYCSHSARCESCQHQTPAPTVNIATSQCPDKCQVYYLGCVGMYCKCFGECTSSAEAGCNEPINAGCHSYYFGEGDQQNDREDSDDGTITDEINDLIDIGKTVPDKIVNFVDGYGEGRYEIFGDFAYVYRNGLLMRIISTRLVDLDDMIRSGIDENDWLDDLIRSGIKENDWLDDLITGFGGDSQDGEDGDNDWLDNLINGFGGDSEDSEDGDNDWPWPWFGL